MKRFILGVGLLAVLFGGSLLVSRKVEALYRPVLEDLTKATELAISGAGDAAKAAAMAAREAWQKNWQFTAAFADHEPMEEVDELFSALSAYLPDSEDFKACCQQLIQRTGAVIRNQTFSWWNLL